MDTSIIISLASFAVAFLSALATCWIIPRKEKQMRYKNNFIITWSLIMDDYNEYERLSKYNGSPLDQAAQLKNKIISNCRVLEYNVKEIKKNNHSKRMIIHINNFITLFNSDNFKTLSVNCNEYIQSF